MKIAVIPARGGSKRIPRKNIRHFAGKPLIAYSLEAAKESGLFDAILVSTDDEDIARTALNYGATHIIHRPASLADDFTGTTPVVQHAIRTFQEANGPVDFVCCIYATAPFLSAESLIKGAEALTQAPEKSFAFSVTSFAFPIQRAIRLAEGGVEAVSPDDMARRSQDLEECYHDAGQFYWGRAEAFLQARGMFATHSIPIILPRHLVQDIDTEEDWARAELMYRAYIQSEGLI